MERNSSKFRGKGAVGSGESPLGPPLKKGGMGGFVLLASCFSLFLIAGCKKEEKAPVQAMPVKKAVAPVQAPVTTVIKEEYVYSPAGKRDPFMPFISMEKKAMQVKVPITPLQLYDLTDLRLVGVIILPGKKVVMIEDPTGKGYHISEGTLIGKNGGRVVEIRKDEVVVEEKYINEMAQTRTRKVSITILREQGGEAR